MGNKTGVFKDEQIADLNEQDRIDLRTFHIGNLVSNVQVKQLTRGNDDLKREIQDVATTPNSLPAFLNKHEDIRQILEAAAGRLLKRLKNK